jgi:hypothetical protein
MVAICIHPPRQAPGLVMQSTRTVAEARAWHGACKRPVGDSRRKEFTSCREEMGPDLREWVR